MSSHRHGHSRQSSAETELFGTISAHIAMEEARQDNLPPPQVTGADKIALKAIEWAETHHASIPIFHTAEVTQKPTKQVIGGFPHDEFVNAVPPPLPPKEPLRTFFDRLRSDLKK